MKWTQLGFVVVLTGVLTGAALAGNGETSTQPAGSQTETDVDIHAEEVEAPAPNEFSYAHGLTIVGACIGAGICTVGGGFGIAIIGRACIESIARQPEAGGVMFGPMVVAAAMVEGGMLFGIVVCLLGVLST